MGVLDTIQGRYSVRRYMPDQVNDDLLEKVLTAAQYAQSAKNLQDWRFVVVRDSETRNKLVEELNELSLAIIDSYTKNGSMEAIIEEAGDVKFRLDSFCKIFNIEQQVNERYNIKKGHLERKAMLNRLGRTVNENIILE